MEYGGIGATDLLVSYGDTNLPPGHGTDAGAGADPEGIAGAPGSCCINLAGDLGVPLSAVRSEHGRAWAVVVRPRARPSLRTFSVATDPHEAGVLVGRTQGPSVPPDRVYLSADHGRTWHATTPAARATTWTTCRSR